MTEIRPAPLTSTACTSTCSSPAPDDGPVVILAHGFPESSWSWRHQLPVAGRRRLARHRPGPAGYGASSAPVGGRGVRHRVAELPTVRRCVDETGQDQAVFVGHDWGALIVWDLVPPAPRAGPGGRGRQRAVHRLARAADRAVPPALGDRFFYILVLPGGRAGRARAGGRRPPHDARRPVVGLGRRRRPRARCCRPPARASSTLGAWPDDLPSWLTADDLDRYTKASRPPASSGRCPTTATSTPTASGSRPFRRRC